MTGFNPIHLAYGVMGVGMFLCMLVAKKQQTALRHASTDFAFAFVQLSNHILSGRRAVALSCNTADSAPIGVLPNDKQPAALQEMITRALNQTSVDLYSRLSHAYDEVEHICGMNKTKIRQFRDPLYEILFVVHAFLTGCENLSSIETIEQKATFDSFINNQLSFRMTLLARISGSYSKEYQELNQDYLDEMSEAEQKERGNRKSQIKGGKK